MSKAGKRSSSRVWGLLAMISSAVLFAAMAIFVRLAQKEGVPGAETTLIRFLFGCGCVLALHKSGLMPVVVRRPGWHVIRGASGGLAILFYFLSLASVAGPGRTSLTNSVLLSNSFFVFAPLFAALMIGERLKMPVIAAVAVSLVGMVLVASPKLSGIRSGDAFAISHGILAGLSLVCVRQLRKTESSAAVFLSLCVFGAIVAGVAMIWQRPVRPDMTAWMIIAGMCVTATAAQLLQTYAMRFIPTGEGGLLSMTTVIYTTVVGATLFRDPFTLTTAVGGILVLGSAGYLVLRSGVADAP